MEGGENNMGGNMHPLRRKLRGQPLIIITAILCRQIYLVTTLISNHIMLLPGATRDLLPILKFERTLEKL